MDYKQAFMAHRARRLLLSEIGTLQSLLYTLEGVNSGVTPLRIAVIDALEKAVAKLNEDAE